jgi:hypothetical protein
VFTNTPDMSFLFRVFEEGGPRFREGGATAYGQAGWGGGMAGLAPLDPPLNEAEVCICVAARHQTLIDCYSLVTLLLQNFLLAFELVSL